MNGNFSSISGKTESVFNTVYILRSRDPDSSTNPTRTFYKKSKTKRVNFIVFLVYGNFEGNL